MTATAKFTVKPGRGQPLKPYNIPGVDNLLPVLSMPCGSLTLSCDTVACFHQREGVIVDILI